MLRIVRQLAVGRAGQTAQLAHTCRQPAAAAHHRPQRLFSSCTWARAPAAQSPAYTFPSQTIRSLVSGFIKTAAEQNGQQVQEQPPVTVHGWVRSVRSMKTMTFIDLDDGSTLSGLQVVLDKDVSNEIKTGSSLRVVGRLLQPTDRKQAIELSATDYTLLGTSDSKTYPLHKARVTFDYLRDHQHLRTRSRTFGALWRLRSIAQDGIHDFFRSQEFVHVNTPILTTHDCEGGGEAFRILTTESLNSHISHGVSQARAADAGAAARPDSILQEPHEFFGKPVYATVSGQLHLEFLASSLSRAYTLSPTFRAEKSQSTRHLAEFWMLEAEACFIDTIPQLLDLIQGNIQHTLRHVLDKGQEDLSLFDKFVEPGLIRRLDATAHKPFARVTYTEAVKMLQQAKTRDASISWEFPVEWGLPLQSEHEKYLSQQLVDGPVFVTDYPASFKPFYMKSSKGGDTLSDASAPAPTVACVDLLMPKMGELVGGSLREDSYETLHRRVVDAGLSVEDYQWYLDLRKYGSAPHGGYGMGFERFLGFMTGMSNVRDLLPAPRAFQHCQY
ncbi:hypothetical protein BC831DRAFT_515486 [Entophlyctis helioformis]|nr:hypothetical protein BC831DRAFT_515486 [Entophlyctis helioformis]